MIPESVLFVLIRISAILVAWLATYLVHSTILLGAGFIVTRTVARSPHAREMIWKVAIVGGILTSILSTTIDLPSVARTMNASPVVEREVWKDAALSRQIGLDSTTTARLFESRVATASERIRLVPVAIVILWALYALAILTGVSVATRRARAALGPRHESNDRALRDRFERVKAKLGLTLPIRLTLSPMQNSPVALGANEICIPERLVVDLDPEEQESVLAHEVAHIVRRDPSWLLATVTIEAILFFQPLNRVARMRIQEEAEYLCDDLAVEKASNGVTLARCLGHVAEWMTSPSNAMLAPALVEEQSSIVPRVKRLLVERESSETSRWKRIAFATVLPVFVLLVAPGFTAGGTRTWGSPAFHWEGQVGRGESVEIKGLMGDIRAESWSGNTVTINATRHGRATQPDIQFAVVESPAGITVCTVYPVATGTPPNICGAGKTGRETNTKANDVEVEYLVRIPSQVGFTARTATGRITSTLLDAPVTAQSSAGNVDVATSSDADISTNAGNVTVRVPPGYSARVDVSSQLGKVNSDFSLEGKSPGFLARLKPRGSFGGNAHGVIGRGARTLRIHTIAGNIAIKRQR